MEFEITQDVSNNLGDILNKAKTSETSPLGKKIKKNQMQLQEARELIKKLNYESPLKETKETYIKFISIFYTAKNLEKQVGIANRWRKVDYMVNTAWNILLSREERLLKLLEEADMTFS